MRSGEATDVECDGETVASEKRKTTEERRTGVSERREELREGENEIRFEDTVTIDTTGRELWEAISDPAVLAECVPGAQRVDQVGDRRYECDVKRGIGHFTISIEAELELVELDAPNWVLTEGEAYDTTTGSRFDVLAAMEIVSPGSDDGEVDIAYSIDLAFTGGVATLGSGIVKRGLRRDLDTYFENVKDTVESDE